MFEFYCLSQLHLGKKRMDPALQAGFEGLVGPYKKVEKLQPLLLNAKQRMAGASTASCTYQDIPAIGYDKIECRISSL